MAKGSDGYECASAEGERESERRERGERDECSIVPGEEGGTEGESEDPVQESPQRHSQLGRSSPSLLPRCIGAPREV